MTFSGASNRLFQNNNILSSRAPSFAGAPHTPWRTKRSVRGTTNAPPRNALPFASPRSTHATYHLRRRARSRSSKNVSRCSALLRRTPALQPQPTPLGRPKPRISLQKKLPRSAPRLAHPLMVKTKPLSIQVIQTPLDSLTSTAARLPTVPRLDSSNETHLPLPQAPSAGSASTSSSTTKRELFPFGTIVLVPIPQDETCYYYGKVIGIHLESPVRDFEKLRMVVQMIFTFSDNDPTQYVWLGANLLSVELRNIKPAPERMTPATEATLERRRYTKKKGKKKLAKIRAGDSVLAADKEGYWYLSRVIAVERGEYGIVYRIESLCYQSEIGNPNKPREQLMPADRCCATKGAQNKDWI
ncbi:hypothetical protein EJ03DRAFT_64926 [Teratosphaeria nubilosa]|uniref:Uncharacterized protein n=1 Tax=Teratosphaeria nubilosa TaxID=161662 RepID=A0A6G1LCH2_9PEZI|nr:hypothetical protein EJ03DRAFT_64926 [Teratosphaeria nubilosa]